METLQEPQKQYLTLSNNTQLPRLSVRNVAVLIGVTWLTRAALLLGIYVSGTTSMGPASADTRASGDGYAALARTWMEHHRYAFAPDARLSVYRGPAYPAAIAVVGRAIGDYDWGAVVVNALFAAIPTLVLYAIGRRLYGDRPAFVIALLGLLYPVAFWYTASPFSDSFLTAVFAFFAWTALRAFEAPAPARFAASGAALGVLILTKPIFVIIPPLAMVYAVLRRRPWIRPLAAQTAIALAVISPWIWRNYRVTGQLIAPASGGGFNLLVGTLMTERFADCNTVFHESTDDALRRVSADTGRAWTRDDIMTAGYYDLTPSQDELFGRLGYAENFNQPTVFLHKVAVNLGRFWSFASTKNRVWLLAAMNLAILLPAVFELWRRRREHADLVAWIVLLVVVVWVGYSVIIVHSRFFLPLMPLLIAPAIGILFTWRGRREAVVKNAPHMWVISADEPARRP